MLRYCTLLLFIFVSLVLSSQIKMEVSEVVISKLETQDTGQMLFTDTPFLEAHLVIENHSDTIITFTPFASSLVTLDYTLDSIQISKRLDSYIVRVDDDNLSGVNPIELKPGKKLYITCRDYLYNSDLMSLYLKDDDTYGDAEERRVIEGSELITAKALKEIKEGEVTRKNHGGIKYRTVGPTSTKGGL